MNTVIEWYRNGGMVMNFILAVAVIGLAVFLERFYVIVVKSKINGRAFKALRRAETSQLLAPRRALQEGGERQAVGSSNA